MTSEFNDYFKAMIVATILNYQPEKAIALLSRHFHVNEPKIGVGVFKGRSKRVRAAYSGKRKEILVAKREYLNFTTILETSIMSIEVLRSMLISLHKILSMHITEFYICFIFESIFESVKLDF